MIRFIKTSLLVFGGLIFVLVLLGLRPVPHYGEKECIALKGTVSGIYEGGVHDVIFKLKEHKQTFYVNRGLEHGLNIAKLKSQLINKEITVKYPDYWAPLVSMDLTRHICKIELEGQTLFTEF